MGRRRQKANRHEKWTLQGHPSLCIVGSNDSGRAIKESESIHSFKEIQWHIWKKGENEGLLHGAPLNFPPLEIEEFIPQPCRQYRQDKCAAGSTLLSLSKEILLLCYEGVVKNNLHRTTLFKVITFNCWTSCVDMNEKLPILTYMLNKYIEKIEYLSTCPRTSK